MRIIAVLFALLPSLAFADDITPDSFANRLKADALADSDEGARL